MSIKSSHFTLVLSLTLATAQLPTNPRSQAFTLQTHRMDVDVDGAPNAYGPPGSHALDNLREDDHPNIPIRQGPHDPYPGFYISQTAFTDPANTNERDPRRYVNASRINYIVLGNRARHLGARLGDFVAVTSLRTHRSVFAIIGDDGNPSGNEGSLHLLQSLGYPFTNGIDDAVEHPEILIRFYPNSNPEHLFFRSQSALDAAALKLHLSRDFSAPHNR
jgi:hypothetical protein